MSPSNSRRALCFGLGLVAATLCAARCSPSPPIPGLPVVVVDDSESPIGVRDQADIDEALLACAPGCNLKFQNATYDDVSMTIGAFPDGFSMYGAGIGKTRLRSPLFGADDWRPIITVGSDAPDGVNEPRVVIRGMTLDGRKQEQVPPLLPGTNDVDTAQTGQAIGILTGPTFGGVPREGGVIRAMEFLDFVATAVVTWDSVEWLIENNRMTGMGCNQADPSFSCGDLLVPNPWDSVNDDSSANPGRKTVGFGVNMINGTLDTTVRSNEIRNVTKLGVQAFASANTTCADSHVARGIVVEGNLVADSHAGYTINGGCEITFLDNVAEGIFVPGGTGNVGNGFLCGRGGDGSSWIGNRSEGNQRSGYNLNCGDGNLLFRDNESIDNCQVNAGADPEDIQTIDDITFQGPSGQSPSGLVIENTTSLGLGNCSRSLRVQRRSNVTITGGVVEGGTDRALWIRGVSGMNVRGLSLVSSQLPGSGDVGVFLDFAEPLSEVYVHPSSLVSGFDDEADSSIPPVFGDGVAYCLEEPEPACDAP